MMEKVTQNRFALEKTSILNKKKREKKEMYFQTYIWD